MERFLFSARINGNQADIVKGCPAGALPLYSVEKYIKNTVGVYMTLFVGLAKLLLLYVYLPFVIRGLLIMAYKIKRWRTAFWAVPLYLALAYVIPLGDVTWHSWHMAQVCPQAGVHIYRRVKVDGYYSSYYAGKETLEQYQYTFVEKNGSPGNPGYTRFERKNGEIVTLLKVPELQAEWELFLINPARPDKKLGVSVNYSAIRNRHTGEVIAESFYYRAWSGWVDAWIGSVIDNTAGNCGEGPRLPRIMSEILIPKGAEQ